MVLIESLTSIIYNKPRSHNCIDPDTDRPQIENLKKKLWID